MIQMKFPCLNADFSTFIRSAAQKNSQPEITSKIINDSQNLPELLRIQKSREHKRKPLE